VRTDRSLILEECTTIKEAVMRTAFLLAGLVLCATAAAQESASFKLDEYVFNAGGHPEAGTILTSPGFRITLDALGDGISAMDLASPSFRLDVGFAASYPPPGEVVGLVLLDEVHLSWNAEPSVGTYNMYRDLMSQLLGLGFGACEQQDLVTTTTIDNDPVPAGDGFFYLITAENRLAEEGTKGFRTGGSERANASPCP
jgi:hypothetical protein